MATSGRNGLGVGTIVFAVLGVAAPAGWGADECTPRVVNLRDSGFTVVWGSPTAEPGHLRVGSTSGNLTTEVCDVRDASAGCPGTFDTHFIQVTGLSASSQYFIQRYEGGIPVGPEVAVSTGPPLPPGVPDSAFGVLLRQDATTHATGAYTCGTIQDADGSGASGSSTPECDLIEQPSDLGFWAVNLNNARTGDLSSRFDYSVGGGDNVAIEACGGEHGAVSATVDSGNASPTSDLVLNTIQVPAAGRVLVVLLGLLLGIGLATFPRG